MAGRSRGIHLLSQGTPSAVTLQRCSPQSHSSPSGSGWASPAHSGEQWGSFHSPSHTSISRDAGWGTPKAKASHSSGYPLTPGREVPPAPRLGPGSGRAVGTVSISRGALLEKEQKPREAINSLLLLHTSASSAPASRGGREGPRAWPGLSPTAKPPPRLRANISI